MNPLCDHFPQVTRNPRLQFGKPLNEICEKRNLHPGLKDLFIKAYLSATDDNYCKKDFYENENKIEQILRAGPEGQGSLNDRLLLKERLETGRYIISCHTPPGAPLWILRHFLGRLPEPLLSENCRHVIGQDPGRYSWLQLSDECQGAIQLAAQGGQQLRQLKLRISAELSFLPRVNFLVLSALLGLIRNLSVYDEENRNLNKFTAYLLTQYFTQSMISRPYRPGYYTERDRQYYALIIFLVYYWSDLKILTIELRNNSPFEKSIEKLTFNTYLSNEPTCQKCVVLNNSKNLNHFTDNLSKKLDMYNRMTKNNRNVATQTDNHVLQCIENRDQKNVETFIEKLSVQTSTTKLLTNTDCKCNFYLTEKCIIQPEKCCAFAEYADVKFKEVENNHETESQEKLETKNCNIALEINVPDEKKVDIENIHLEQNQNSETPVINDYERSIEQEDNFSKTQIKSQYSESESNENNQISDKVDGQSFYIKIKNNKLSQNETSSEIYGSEINKYFKGLAMESHEKCLMKPLVFNASDDDLNSSKYSYNNPIFNNIHYDSDATINSTKLTSASEYGWTNKNTLTYGANEVIGHTVKNVPIGWINPYSQKENKNIEIINDNISDTKTTSKKQFSFTSIRSRLELLFSKRKRRTKKSISEMQVNVKYDKISAISIL